MWWTSINNLGYRLLIYGCFYRRAIFQRISRKSLNVFNSSFLTMNTYCYPRIHQVLPTKIQVWISGKICIMTGGGEERRWWLRERGPLTGSISGLQSRCQNWEENRTPVPTFDNQPERDNRQVILDWRIVEPTTLTHPIIWKENTLFWSLFWGNKWGFWLVIKKIDSYLSPIVYTSLDCSFTPRHRHDW